MAEETSGLEGEKLAKTETSEMESETRVIKERIETTRESMGETIDAIQERLSLSNISDSVSETVSTVIETAKNQVYDATLGKAVEFMKNTGKNFSTSGVGRSMAKNPLPYVLIGAGSALLLYNGFSKKKGNGRVNGRSRSTQEGNGGGYAERSGNGISETARSAYSSVASTAGGALSKVSGAAGDTVSKATDVVGKAYGKVGELGHNAHETYDHYVEEKPLAVAAAAAAVGAVIGLSIPATRYEGKLIGEKRDELLSAAGDSVTQLADRAKELVGDPAQAVKAGLTAVSNVTDLVSETGSKGSETSGNDTGGSSGGGGRSGTGSNG